jgi:hypothetical protein
MRKRRRITAKFTCVVDETKKLRSAYQTKRTDSGSVKLCSAGTDEIATHFLPMEIAYGILTLLVLGGLIYGGIAYVTRDKRLDPASERATRELYADPGPEPMKEDVRPPTPSRNADPGSRPDNR